MKTVFNFRTIKATDVTKHSALRAAAAAGKCTLITDATTGNICRNSVELEFAAPNLNEFPASFIQSLVDAAIESAAKRKVDNFEVVKNLTVDEIIAANTASGRTSSTLPEEVWTKLLAYCNAKMTERKVKPGTLATISQLVKGKFKAQVCNKYAAQQSAFPTILAAVLGYVEELALVEGEQAELAHAVYVELMPAVDQLQGNYAKWLEVMLASDEELDMSAL